MKNSAELYKTLEATVAAALGCVVVGGAVYALARSDFQPPALDSNLAQICLRAMGNRPYYRQQIPIECHPFQAIFPDRKAAGQGAEPLSASSFTGAYRAYYTPNRLHNLIQKEADLVGGSAVGGGVLAFCMYYAGESRRRRKSGQY